jgi:hypothetical protein
MSAGPRMGYYFQGDFQGVTLNSDSHPTINWFADNHWDALRNHALVATSSATAVQFNNSGRDDFGYVGQSITSSYDSGRDALYMFIYDDDPDVTGTTRAQMSIRMGDDTDLSVYHTSHRMKLSSDIQYLENHTSSFDWFTLYEIWNEIDPEMTGDTAGSARWGLALNKNSGAGQPLFWRAKCDWMQPEEMNDEECWAEYNHDVPIPYDQWFKLDLYMKRGYGTAGRFKITITIDGGNPQVLFDVRNHTMYAENAYQPNRPDLKIYSLQPFKLYTYPSVVLSFMIANNKLISAHYNDFKWHTL